MTKLTMIATAVWLVLAVFFAGALSIQVPSFSFETTRRGSTFDTGPEFFDFPCTLDCLVKITEGAVQVEDLHVKWYRKTSSLPDGEFLPVRGDYWGRQVAYPSDIGCQQTGSQRFDCNLTIPFCGERYFGNYRCDVSYVQGNMILSKNSRHITLTNTQLDFEDVRCFIPAAYDLTLVVHEQNDSFVTSASLYWNVTTKPDGVPNCMGARRWQVRSVAYDLVTDTAEDHANNDDVMRHGDPAEWQNTKPPRGQNFTFTALDRSRYYVFQVQNDASMDHRADDYRVKIRQYASHVYYFGQQDAPRLLTAGGTVYRTVGEDYEIQCKAIGSPSPEVEFHSSLGTAIPEPFKEFRPVSRVDAGSYYCLASNILVNPPEGKRSAADIVKITLEVENPTVPPDLEVTCTTYTDDICTPFIYGEIDIYVNTSVASQELVEDAFRAIDAIPGQQDDSRLEQCAVLAKAMACHSVFPYCDPSSLADGKVVPRPICGHTCAIFRDGGECAGVIDSPDLQALLLSRCGLEDEAGNPPECHPISLEAPETGKQEAIKKTISCISGNGRGYMGDREVTASGKDCQRWGSSRPHVHPMFEVLFPEEIRDAGFACRNPGGLGKRPWCYTSDPSTRWEYCDIPKCEFCQPYEGTFCKDLPGFNTSLVYVDWKQSGSNEAEQATVERNILGFYHGVKAQESVEVSPGCDHALRLLLCYGALPFCNEASDENSRKLCSDFCQLLNDTDLCPGLREEISSFMKDSNSPLVEPECGVSPNVEIVGSSRDSEVKCQPIAGRLQATPDMQATDKCYNDLSNGQTYEGRVSRTLSGDLCQRWDEDTPHPHHVKEDIFPELVGAEDYCRNPGQLRERPWCFTTNVSVEWDYCDIPRCDSDEPKTLETSSAHSPSHGIVYGAIFGTLIIGIVLIFIVVSVMCYRHHSRKDIPPPLARYQAGSGEMKLVYNSKYFTPNTIPRRIAEIMEGFPRFDKAKIKYLRQLGQGNFGVVFQGKAAGLVDGEDETLVAVKTLKEEASPEGLENFVREAKLMFSFDHPNIIKIHAVCMADLPYYMIFEFMEKGDLTQFLRSSASSIQRRYMNPFGLRSRTESQMSNDPPELDTLQLTDICKQVAAGMEYLAEMKHVHRDLACRNCLVHSRKNGIVVKIGDFGMSHNLYTRDYYRVNGQAILPVRWMSPEAVVYGKFSSAGDVWSFGIVMWEVFSFAMQPYYGTSNEEVAESIRKGRVLQKPLDCPNKMYDIMKECWNMNPKNRPTFKELHQILLECRSSTSSASDRFPSLDSINTLDSDAFLEENSVDGLSIDMENIN